MRPFRLSLLVVAFSVAAAAQAQQYEPLARRMSEAQFKAAGLDRLTPAQLQALDDWLRTHDKPTTRVVDTSGKPVFYPEPDRRRLIEAHLVGQFSGWNGHNVLSLDNGQQWKQTGSDEVMCNTSANPAVKVRPSLFGNWLLHVDGCNGSAHVERVK
ncbi:MAG: hypothetical protein HOQ10_11850 [Frateuria sp.]|uniref:hypothetical protein n=1 Tax=Frateuria sp. TaxID=2211372 RepID=UPI00181E8657|nr:hypothetical protein [Frateuria sp.]NUO73393.1 hypothetical protein [Frateuria sp.]NUR22746.1 hypothetical protein [Frateuria sp.]